MVEYSEKLHELLFPGFSEPDVNMLLSSMKKTGLNEGDILFSSGENGDSLFFVVQGRLAVQKRTGFGDRTQAVALLDPGAPVGERALAGVKKHGATLLAAKKTTLLSLSYQSFADIKKDDPLLAVKLLELLLGKTSLRLEKSAERLSHVL
ncbi:MAG: cyclic nucleotide-binding domain-containing protein [Deltaproteobacteria bacterium]|nr:cyclic nucleotide-binding domain-containing protein [Deltaproteobacteria bacterium]MBW2658168.1 cyclic nucleotide-binding domain-containing protein [Deltaproteobacteria bacterium]